MPHLFSRLISKVQVFILFKCLKKKIILSTVKISESPSRWEVLFADGTTIAIHYSSYIFSVCTYSGDLIEILDGEAEIRSVMKSGAESFCEFTDNHMEIWWVHEILQGLGYFVYYEHNPYTGLPLIE